MLCTALVVCSSDYCKVVKRVQSSQGEEASPAFSLQQSTSETTALNPDYNSHPIAELDSSSYNELPLASSSNSLSSDSQSVSMLSSSTSSLDLSTSDLSSNTSDDMFLSDCAATSSSSPPVIDDEIDGDIPSEILREQQTAWEDPISENLTDLL